MSQDLYKVLGVARDASAAEIKKAYRSLAKKYHPDATGGEPGASEKFKQVSSAFEVLGDKEKRNLYNEFGQESLRPGFDAGKARAYQKWSKQATRGGSPFAWQGVDFGGDAGGFNFSGAGRRPGRGPGAGQAGFGNIIDELFGGGGGRGGRSGPPQRSLDSERELGVDLGTAMRGGAMRLSVDVDVPCDQCNGRGHLGHSQQQPCMACSGRGTRLKKQRLTVNIPARTPDGSTLRIKGKGSQDGAGRSGDLILSIRIKDDPVFRREGKDLHVELPIRVDEAMHGAKVPLLTPDGRTLTLTVKPGAQSGQSLRLKGQGLGTGKGVGNLVATLSIRLPQKVAPKVLEEFSAGYTGDELQGGARASDASKS